MQRRLPRCSVHELWKDDVISGFPLEGLKKTARHRCSQRSPTEMGHECSGRAFVGSGTANYGVIHCAREVAIRADAGGRGHSLIKKPPPSLVHSNLLLRSGATAITFASPITVIELPLRSVIVQLKSGLLSIFSRYYSITRRHTLRSWGTRRAMSLNLCLPKTLSGMTRGWAYGNEAADGRVSDPAAVCFPLAASRGERGLRPKISSCANS